ncbi:MAG: ATP-binding protein [Candidatus Krumholzibacteria bacterium]|nr:ATP-binding protein [Candidatus Krumholzibacteria bacterium]
MVHRKWWKNLIEEAWLEKNVVWLSGIRRVGKTFLCRSLPDIEYFDCELPRTRRSMDDPESFLESLSDRRIVLDEVHRLQNPAQLLKIAADHFPACRILATGSSTLGASAKFKDTLSGRKRDLWLTPMTTLDLTDFENEDLHHRLLRGGLPPFFLSKQLPERDFQEWVDAYWAKDIQELFRLQSRNSFQKFVELLLAQSGGIFEATRFAGPCEVSRTTISNYLAVLEATFVAHVIKPFNSHRPTEIVSAPKVFGFDTGFVCYHRGWNELRADDYGILWEHFVLNEMQASLQTRKINYWRDKRGHEVDFVLVRPGNKPIAIESKWSADGFDPGNLYAFRKQYPSGENYVVARDVKRKYSRKYRDISVEFVSLPDLIARIPR